MRKGGRDNSQEEKKISAGFFLVYDIRRPTIRIFFCNIFAQQKRAKRKRVTIIRGREGGREINKNGLEHILPETNTLVRVYCQKK